MKKMKIAMIGVGDISGIYLENIHNTFRGLELVGVCDLVEEKAVRAREKYGVPKLYKTMYDAFADAEVDIVLNLTRPYEHYEVSKAALLAGKHVYSEKPLAASLELGLELVSIAEEKGLMIGGAPDTFLGSGIQSCRNYIDAGLIGDPIGAAAFMICRGHESWHPDPEFYYKLGGGPMMDMGPYYVTALINLLGGVSGLTGVTKKSFDTRLITSQPKSGTVVQVDVPTYVAGVMNFDCGAVGTIFTTFDVYYEGQARIEIYGSKGTLIVPDPNTFGGPIKLLRPEEGSLKELPLLFDYAKNSRALGLTDMAAALLAGRAPRCGYNQTLHVLEVMTGFERSSETGRYVRMETRFERKPPMRQGLLHGVLDE